MGVWTDYKMSDKVEQNGSWKYFDGYSVKVARQGGSNAAFRKVYDRVYRPYRRAMDAGTLGVKKQDELMAEVYAECMIPEWKGMDDEEGNVLECTKENILMIFEKLPDFFNEIYAYSNDKNNYREANIEEDVGN